MCELFGVCSAEKVICNPYLKTFYSNAVNHPDGWGLARFGRNTVSIEKEPISAMQSFYLENRLTDAIEEDILLAHIRKASIGHLSYKNTHPFTGQDASGRQWTLIHNGTIFENEKVDAFREVQNGSCDSERILLYLLHEINAEMELLGKMPWHGQQEIAERQNGGKGIGEPSRQGVLPGVVGGLNAEERFGVFERVIQEITPKNKVNILAFDGETFYVHTNHPNSLYCHRNGTAMFFCTRPLSDEEWKKIPLNTLFGYRAGTPVFCGTEHSNLFLKEHETAAGYDSLRSVDIFYI